MSLDRIRRVIDDAPSADTTTLARTMRNAIARAVLAEALAHEEPRPPEREPPLEELRQRLGAALTAELAAVYAGGPGWTTHAIDALEPLHALARA